MFKQLRYGVLIALAAAALAACSSAPSNTSPTAAPTTTTTTPSTAPATCSVHAKNAIIDAMDVAATCYTVPQAVQKDTQDQFWVNTGYQVAPKAEQHESGRMYVPITRTSQTLYTVQLSSRDRSEYSRANDPAYYQGAGWAKAVASGE